MKVINALNKNIEKISNINPINIKTNEFIISIPHSGIFIPYFVKNNYKIDKSMLIGTDIFTDKLYNIKNGIIIKTNLNIYILNMNRFKKGSNKKSLSLSMQQDPFHEPSLTTEKILLKEPSLDQKNILMKYYKEYHQLIIDNINELKKQHGYALLFDCHSMNSIGLTNSPDSEKKRPDFTIGTLNKSSANEKIIEYFLKKLKNETTKFNYSIKIDDPFKGGAITRLYGIPNQNIHTLQIEIKKKLYMDEILDVKSNKKIILNTKKLKIIKKIIENTIVHTSNFVKKLYIKNFD
jgi:N-formylglutamate deformylase